MAEYTEQESQVLRAFGEAVRNLRQQRKISQEALGAAVGLHRTYIGSVERGQRNVSLLNICRLAEALNVPVSKLFDIFIVEK